MGWLTGCMLTGTNRAKRTYPTAATTQTRNSIRDEWFHRLALAPDVNKLDEEEVKRDNNLEYFLITDNENGKGM
uniref:Uncharacterized protein n=1 Tax=Caenorhabditis japonica TaxID=281687 RepID=A0A8R1EAH1_CAEJA